MDGSSALWTPPCLGKLVPIQTARCHQAELQWQVLFYNVQHWVCLGPFPNEMPLFLVKEVFTVYTSCDYFVMTCRLLCAFKEASHPGYDWDGPRLWSQGRTNPQPHGWIIPWPYPCPSRTPSALRQLSMSPGERNEVLEKMPNKVIVSCANWLYLFLQWK